MRPVRKKITVLLMALAVFITTYTLTMPASSFSKWAAEEEPGLTLNEYSETEEKETVSEDHSDTEESEETDLTEIKEETPEEAEVPETVSEETEPENTEETVSAEPEAAPEEGEELINADPEPTEPQEQEIISEGEYSNKETTEANEEQSPVSSFPAVEFADTIENVVTVRVSAEEGTFPEGTTMTLTPVEQEEVIDTVKETVETEVKQIVAVDITFKDIDGNEIEPLKPISVSMVSPMVKEAEESLEVVHIDNEGNGTVVEKTEEAEREDEVTFTSDTFSVYVLAYTVDFHYEVNEKQYDYSMPGGSVITLKELLPMLNVIDTERAEEFVSNIASVSITDETLVRPVYIEEDVTVEELYRRLNVTPEYSSSLTQEEINAMLSRELHTGEWVLISLKAFDSEEIMTVTMKDNEVFTVKVTDAAGTWLPDSEKNVDNAEEGIIIKLFDYTGTTSQGKNIDAEWGANNNNSDPNLWRNGTGINNGRSLLFTGSGLGNGVENYNKFTGSKPANAQYYSGYVYQGIVKNQLVNGYPVFSNTVMNSAQWKDRNDGGSLGYLFGAGGQDGVTAYTGEGGNGLQGLLLKNSDGYYYYDSEKNYAQLVGNELKLYTDTYDKADSQSGTTIAQKKKIGFFPFDVYNSDNKEEKTPNGGKLHHQFGLTMETDFVYPPGGNLDEDPNKPMIFNFSGDDDVWVFIDGVLVLDLGGVHQPIDGSINFSTGQVTIKEYNSNNQASYAKNTTIAQMFAAAGKTFDSSDYSSHKLQFFYLERGGCDSNMKLEFNMPLVMGEGSVRIAKKDSLTDELLPGATFELHKKEDCSDEPLQTKTSGSEGANNGLVVFDELKVTADDYTYYLKETGVPIGYQSTGKVYRAVARTQMVDGRRRKFVKDDNGEIIYDIFDGDTKITTISYPPYDYSVIPNTPIRTKHTVTKVWDGFGNDGWPENVESVRIGLYYQTHGADPVLETTYDLDAQHQSYTFENLIAYKNNNEVTYFAKEESILYKDGTRKTPQEAGITLTEATSGTTTTVTNKYETEASVKKEWNDKDNQDGKRPSEISVALVMQYTITEEDPETHENVERIVSEVVESVTLKASENWEAKREHLNQYYEGHHVTYTWTEESLPEGYVLESTGSSGTLTTLTNSPSTDFNPRINYLFTKTWNDSDNPKARPDALVVKLKADGHYVHGLDENGNLIFVDDTEHKTFMTATRRELDPEKPDEWIYEFTNLPVFAPDGHAYIYTAEEVKPEGYEKTKESTVPTEYSVAYNNQVTKIHPNNQKLITLANDYNLGWVIVNKGSDFLVWTQRPATLEEKKLLDTAGKATYKNSYKAENGEEHSSRRFVSGLGKHTLLGAEIEFRMQGSDIYVNFKSTSDWSWLAFGQFTGTYTQGYASATNTVQLTEAHALKTWNDSDNAEGKRPDSITYRLVAEYTDTDSVKHQLTAEQLGINSLELVGNKDTDPAYSADWTKLPQFTPQGRPITYSIEEILDEESAKYYSMNITETVAGTHTWTAVNTLVCTEITAVKTMKNGDAPESVYQFTISAPEGTPMPDSDSIATSNGIQTLTVTNTEGTVNFGKIYFRKDDLKSGETYLAQKVFTYTVKEVQGDDEHTVYDASEYTAEITVTYDSETETLTVSDPVIKKKQEGGSSAPAETIEFVNEKQIDFEFTKVWIGDDEDETNPQQWPEGKTITVVLNRSNDDSYAMKYEIGWDADANAPVITPKTNDAPVMKAVSPTGNKYIFVIKNLDQGTAETKYTYTISEEGEIEGYHIVYGKYNAEDGTFNSKGFDGFTTNGGVIANELTTYELPHTGGIGTIGYHILGSMLALAAFILLNRKKH